MPIHVSCCVASSRFHKEWNVLRALNTTIQSRVLPWNSLCQTSNWGLSLPISSIIEQYIRRPQECNSDRIHLSWKRQCHTLLPERRLLESKRRPTRRRLFLHETSSPGTAFRWCWANEVHKFSPEQCYFPCAKVAGDRSANNRCVYQLSESCFRISSKSRCCSMLGYLVERSMIMAYRMMAHSTLGSVMFAWHLIRCRRTSLVLGEIQRQSQLWDNHRKS